MFTTRHRAIFTSFRFLSSTFATDASRTPVIVSAVRTPIGSFDGAFASLTAPQLGAVAIKEAVKRSGSMTISRNLQ